jgi:hypothetical protein
MKTYRFVVMTCQDVVAEDLEKAIETFTKMRHARLSPGNTIVERIEVRDEKGEYVPVDRPLRAEYLVVRKQPEIRLSA